MPRTHGAKTVHENVRTVKLTWIEDYSYYFRWFKTQKAAENWAWKHLIDKNVCYANQIQIHCVR